MNTTHKLTFVALAVLLTVGPATAQIIAPKQGGFGSVVSYGDVDYVPLTKQTSSYIRAVEADFGIPGQVSDNCIMLVVPNTDGGTIVAFSAGGAYTLRNKDIRLTPCDGRLVGTAVSDSDVTEKARSWRQRAVEVHYADVNNNGKYDKGDNVYLSTRVGAGGVGMPGLAASTATGAWTIRITPVGNYPAGSFVFAGDLDFVAYGAVAPGYQGTGARTWSIVEREGNAWYIIPYDMDMAFFTLTVASSGAATPPSATFKPFGDARIPYPVAANPNGFAAGGLNKVGLAPQSSIPANSIRMGATNVFSPQPNIQPSALQVNAPGGVIKVGESFPIIVTVTNSGTAAGQGVLVTKLSKAIADVRMTPLLAPGESTKMLVTVPAPTKAGPGELEVNDVFQAVSVTGTSTATASSFASTDEVAALREQVAALQAQLAQPTHDVKVQKASTAPGLAPVALIVVVLGLALAMRRKA